MGEVPQEDQKSGVFPVWLTGQGGAPVCSVRSLGKQYTDNQTRGDCRWAGSTKKDILDETTDECLRKVRGGLNWFSRVISG